MFEIKNFKKKKDLLFSYQVGLEREALRITQSGELSKHPHPKELGSPLTHPYFGTDFAEVQIEWNTPPFSNIKQTSHFLSTLMNFTAEVHPNELFWPYSMPCKLPPNIQLAYYGSSHLAKKKEIYREGLKKRYGTNLQMISGVHFNFSFSEPFWNFVYDLSNSPLNRTDFISDSYFKIMRNFLREGWLLTYLFGASPAVHPSYFESIPSGFIKKDSDTLVHPEATSIRMSYYGYYSRIQNQLAISFNDLESYLMDMEYAIKTPYLPYKQIETQLSDNLLQIENEHYSRIRPKAKLHKNETPLQALRNRGVEYLEIRAVDINPFHPLGISQNQLLFLHQFLLYCLFKESPALTKEDQRYLIDNQSRVALEGRQKELMLKNTHPILMTTWAEVILKEMAEIAQILGQEYQQNLALQVKKILNPSLTPSAEILKALKNETLVEFGLNLAKKHHQNAKKVTERQKILLQKTVQKSLLEVQKLETASEILLEGYEHLELSTQILIKKALEHGVNVEVLDEKDQIIRLTKGSHVEYVKQATKTSKDSYISPNLMKNKHITKMILHENGLSVPIGKIYRTFEDAFKDYPLYIDEQVVVKPMSTNYGLAIFFIDPHDFEGYKIALKEVLKHGHSVIVETFCHGQEYRFLVINGKVEAIVSRIPAHIIGDGHHTIRQLIDQKNHDPFFYRSEKTYLRLTQIEKTFLKKQNLSPNSIPKTGKTVFLRQNSNVSTGGDSIDFTDSMHESYKQIAIQAAQALRSAICGVDIIIQDFQTKAAKANYSIIESNYNPVLFMHAFPNKGKKREVAEPILKLLGFIK